MLGHFPRQQVEGDAVVADHRLAHGAEGGRQLVDDFVLGNAQLVVARAVVPGDQVGVLELVAALAAGIFKADGEGRQVVHRLRAAADQQAGVDTAGQQHARPRRHAGGWPRLRGSRPVRGGPAFQVQLTLIGVGPVLQLPPGLTLDFAVAVDTHPGAGFQLCTFASKVRGAGFPRHGS